VKIDNDTKCEPGDTRVYQQSREAGRGCLVSVPATENTANRPSSARNYFWVAGWPAFAHQIHPQEQ